MKFGEKWNNPYLLTVQLDTVLATKYMDSSIRTLFSIQTEAAITDQSKQVRVPRVHLHRTEPEQL